MADGTITTEGRTDRSFLMRFVPNVVPLARSLLDQTAGKKSFVASVLRITVAVPGNQILEIPDAQRCTITATEALILPIDPTVPLSISRCSGPPAISADRVAKSPSAPRAVNRYFVVIASPQPSPMEEEVWVKIIVPSSLPSMPSWTRF